MIRTGVPIHSSSGFLFYQTGNACFVYTINCSVSIKQPSRVPCGHFTWKSRAKTCVKLPAMVLRQDHSCYMSTTQVEEGAVEVGHPRQQLEIL